MAIPIIGAAQNHMAFSLQTLAVEVAIKLTRFALFMGVWDRFLTMSEPKRSWLEGPMIPGDADDPLAPGRWPGEKLGLPESGPGALASVMRRAVGITLDWLASMLLAIVICNFTTALGGVSTLTLVIFCIVSVVSVWLFARTPGQAMLGMGVARIDAADRVGFIRALARTALTVFIFPPIMVDSDGRGLHDRATQTAVIFG